MLRRSAIILVICLATLVARADGLTTVGASGGEKASSSGYQGPGDVVSGAAAWWGFRGYNAAYSGNAAIICTALDASCETETISNGNLVLGTVGAACLVSGTCLVKTLYDQSGSNLCGGLPCNITNTTAANQPTFLASALNGVPCAQFGGAHILESANTATTHSQPVSLESVAERTGSTSSYSQIVSTHLVGGGLNMSFWNHTNEVGTYAGNNNGTPAAATDNAFHTIDAVVNAASSLLYVDGTQTSTSTSPGTNGTNSTLAIGANPDSGAFQYLTGIVCEGGIWATGFNSTQLASMTANQQSYWGL